MIAGIAGGAGSEVFAVTRYNADGSLDTTFANGGIADTSFGGDDQAAAVTLLANGDILVAGTSTTIVNGQTTGSQFALAEYTSAGVLDTTFGNGTGQVLTSFSSSTPGTLSNDVASARGCRSRMAPFTSPAVPTPPATGLISPSPRTRLRSSFLKRPLAEPAKSCSISRR